MSESLEQELDGLRFHVGRLEARLAIEEHDRAMYLFAVRRIAQAEEENPQRLCQQVMAQARKGGT